MDIPTVIHMNIPTTTATEIKKSRKNLKAYLYLLHISDPMLPIGGFTHSNGLETYVQKELVNSPAATRNYLESYLKNNFLYNDLLAARLAWEDSRNEDLCSIIELNEILCASKAPKELRNASNKLGLRLLKILEDELDHNLLFKNFIQSVKDGTCDSNYCVVYGVAANLLGINLDEAMCALTYNTASTVINNCAKLIPISQMVGQKLLFEMQEQFEEIINAALELTIDDLGLSSTGFDIRSMQHERLYTRIYIS